MQACLNILQGGWEETITVENKLKAVKMQASLYVDSFFFNRSSERYYHDLAVDHALEILSSIEKRFVVGSEEPTRFGLNLSLTIKTGEELFN